MADVLIVIDMQKALKNLDQREETIQIINQRIAKYRENKRPIVFIQHTEPGMEVASNGWQLFDNLDALGNDTYYLKMKPDSFYQTGLESYLRMNHYDSIEICGAQVEFCVDTTIRVAYHLGFSIDILADGITTMDTNDLSAQQIKKHHVGIWNNRFGRLVDVETKLN